MIPRVDSLLLTAGRRFRVVAADAAGVVLETVGGLPEHLDLTRDQFAALLADATSAIEQVTE